MTGKSLEAYEDLLGQQDGIVAQRRLDEIRSGTTEVLSADAVAKEFGL